MKIQNMSEINEFNDASQVRLLTDTSQVSNISMSHIGYTLQQYSWGTQIQWSCHIKNLPKL